MEAIKTTIAENFGGPAHNIVSDDQYFDLEKVPSLTGKVAVVTGGSEGIGYACTYTLLKAGVSKLFILSVSQEVVDGALDAMKQELGEDVSEKVKWIQCDLSDWKKTGEVAFEIANSTDRIDILINNAARGIMTYQLAPTNGIDLHMAANHMGHVILTSHLLPLLKKTSEKGDYVRVVSLSSNAHQNAPKDVKYESIDELNTDLGPNGQYGRTKLANLLYIRYMARHLKSSYPKLLFNATHPGFVETRQSTEFIHEAYPLGGYAMSVGMNPLKKDNFMGAVSTVYAATTTEGTGQYICPPAIVEPGSELSQNEQLGEQLMKLTREVVREKTQFESAQKGCPFKDY